MAKDQSDILKEILKQSKNPKAIERAQSELADASKRKAEIVAQMKGTISAPIARSTTELSEVTKETGKGEAVNAKLNENLANLVRESKDQNTNLKKIIKLNEKSIEDNSELFGRLEKTMNALLDSVSEQGRKEGRFGVKGGVDGGVESSNKKQEDEKNPIWEKIKDMLGIGAGAAAGAVATKALSKDAAKAAAKPSLLRKAGKFGLLGAGAGFLGGALSGEDNQLGGALAGGAIGAAGSALYEGGKALLTPKEPTPKAEPRYKFNEKTGRFHDTMKGVGGGEMISDAKAKELGLEKPITEETTKAAEKTEAKVVEKTTEKAAGKVEAKTTEKIVAGAETEVAKDAVKAVEKGGAKEAVQKGGTSAVKEAVAKLGPKFAKGLVKAVPFVGALAGLAFAIGRASEGDFKGAAAEAVSGGASIFAGPGTAASVAIDVGLLVRDVYKAVHGVFPDDDPEFSQEKMTEVKTAVTDYVSSLLPQTEEKKKEEENNKTITPGSAPSPTSPTTPEKDITETSVDEEEIYKSLTKDLPENFKNDVSVQQDYREQAKIQAKVNAKKTPPPAADVNPKVEAPKGNTEAGVTPDIDMGFQIGGRKEFDKELVNQTAAQPGVTPDISGGFQIEGRKEFDKGLVNQQAATPGVTPDIAGVMPSANETPPPPVQEKGKVEKPLSEEATKLIDQYMKEYQYGLKAMQTVLPLETKKEDLVAAADEKYRFDPLMLRKLSEIKRTPGKAVEKLKEKKLEAADKLLQAKRIKSAESSDAGNLGTDYKATELTPTVETPMVDAMGNASGVNITGGEEVQSAMEAARASDEGSMGLITTAREVSPELQKNSIAMQRASNISKFGRSNAMGMDAFMGYDDPPPLALPTAEQVAQGQTEAVKKADAKAQMINGQQPANNQAPIIINQGDNINNVTNNNTSGGNSGGVGSPSRIQNPWDALTLGKPWEAYP
jgi:hypothetical protein